MVCISILYLIYSNFLSAPAIYSAACCSTQVFGKKVKSYVLFSFVAFV